MSRSRWDRFVDKSVDVFMIIGLGSVALMMLGLLIVGVVVLIMQGL